MNDIGYSSMAGEVAVKVECVAVTVGSVAEIFTCGWSNPKWLVVNLRSADVAQRNITWDESITRKGMS